MEGNIQPSKTLWIGFPPSFRMDEQMLHNALILFGEINRIRSVPSQNCSFVEFRSIDEARRAKEGLQGRLFNDPQIMIKYSSSELAPGKDYSGFYPGSKGPRPDVLLNEHPFRPPQMDMFGHNRPTVPNNFPEQLPPGGNIAPIASIRPFGHQGLEPPISGPGFNEMGTIHNFQDGNSKSQIVPNWKRPFPPAPGMLSSPVPGTRPPTRFISGANDVHGINQFPRDSKRSRIDGALVIHDAPFPLRNIDGGFIDPKSHHGPVGIYGVPGSVQPDMDHIWRGIIAKAGKLVCHARCVPIGTGIGTELPHVVDCTARTTLDMLTKYYADAIGFGTIFFLPDSEEDFASYTEFLCYLKSQNRAGVAKCIDNTTLFLVPPSDFLTKVLKVTGPERLYGVILNFPSIVSMQQATHLPAPSTQYMQQVPPSQTEYGFISANGQQVLTMDYNRMSHADSKLPPKPFHPTTTGPPSVHSVPPDYAPSHTVSTLQAGVTLTPELIATLTSLLPAGTQSSTIDWAKTAAGSSTVQPPFPPVAPNDGNLSYLWKQDHQIGNPSGHPSQQFGTMYNVPSAQYQHYPSAYTPVHPAQVVPGNYNFQDTAASLQQQGTVSSGPVNNFIVPSQSGPVGLPPHVSQQYSVEVSSSTQNGYGMVQGADASVLYSAQAFQQPYNPIASVNQVPDANPSQQQTVLPYTADNVNSEPPSQQLQSANFEVGQGTSEVEADRNQRYQAALQFASSLLLQIQQKQTDGGHGPENQQ
ncbi:putative RNA recognition motif domain-containing protein [Lupinus albus]|uniref:Putative RNA recognition motif domain-containing protein n=1 Tax=Lupinus albus TaxID=3870 RepID=A0A6A4NB37_LUPAL|nr:putative RNA recognition motif domain-containing protein [Lupinus albus]